MNNLEIKEQIDRNNKIIESIFVPNQFVLNNSIRELLKENEELQKKCTHQFEDGYCIFCYKEQNL